MTTITQPTLKTLTTNDLATLARAVGPCVSLRIPDYHPGAAGATRPLLVRQLTQNAAAHLRKMSTTSEAEAIIEALEGLPGLREATHGGVGLSVFAAPSLTEVYKTPGVKEACVVGDYFDLLPHVDVSSAPHQMFALGLSRKHVRLWSVADGEAEELALPAGVPVSLEAAGAFDKPDHTLENRTSAGPSSGGLRGATRGIRFGTSSDHDSEANYLHNFFVQVHRGLKTDGKNAPLFLIGSKDELVEYRKIANDQELLPGEWHAAPEQAPADQVAAHAMTAAVARATAASEAVAKAIPEAAHHIAGDLAEIAKAAREGRVHKLVVAAQPGGPDLNALVVEALRTGASVHTIDARNIENVGIAGAILRY